MPSVILKNGKKVWLKSSGDRIDFKKIRKARELIKKYKDRSERRRVARNGSIRLATFRELTLAQNFVIGLTLLKTKNADKRRAFANNIAFMGGFRSGAEGRRRLAPAFNKAKRTALQIIQDAGYKLNN